MNRRTFLMSSAASLALASAPLPAASAARPSPRNLMVGTRTIDVGGKPATVFGLTNAKGGFGLYLDAGEDFDVLVDNTLAEPTMIHWHGLTPPSEMDGVPDLPMPLLAAQEQRRYTFPAGRSGTHWMHAHTLQEQNLLAAPLIVRTKQDRATDEQEVVILLHDFSFRPAEELLATLGAGDPDHATGMVMPGMSGSGTMDHSMMMDMGTMSGMDLNDLTYDAYLANDRTLDDPEIVQVDKGGRVRLRLINGASSTAFTVDLGTLAGTVLAVDGNPVAPVDGSRFPLSMGQRIDLRVTIPADGGAFPVLALREGAPERTGIMLATQGATIRRLPSVANEQGPVLGLDLESRLSAAFPLAHRLPDRRMMAHLSGNMAPYVWSIGGGPFKVAPNERIEIQLMNMSMMAHPMHLHGHHFQVVGMNGRSFAGAMRDTVLVPPMNTVTIAFDTDNPAASWAFHCHHLYHMVSGMMTTLDYASA